MKILNGLDPQAISQEQEQEMKDGFSSMVQKTKHIQCHDYQGVAVVQSQQNTSVKSKGHRFAALRGDIESVLLAHLLKDREQ